MDKPVSTLDQKKDRRGLLALIGAGGAAAVAALLGRSNGAEAASLYGDSNGTIPAVHGNNTAGGPGVRGDANTDNGVHGYSNSGNGMKGQSGTATGVRGIGNPGVRGESTGGYGVYGTSDSSYGVYGTSDSGYGVIGASGSGYGVFGYGGQKGVHGSSPNGFGVYGASHNGNGVRGEGTGAGSVGVLAKNASDRAALRTKGRVKMDCARTKKLVNRSNLVTLPSGVNAGTKVAVLATVQGNPGNDAVIKRAYRVNSNHIRIVFNKKPARSTKVGYWVVHTG